jgi:hypothetical protein
MFPAPCALSFLFYYMPCALRPVFSFLFFPALGAAEKKRGPKGPLNYHDRSLV